MGSIIIMEETFAILAEKDKKQILSVATLKEIEETGVKYLKIEE